MLVTIREWRGVSEPIETKYFKILTVDFVREQRKLTVSQLGTVRIFKGGWI
jgi:hypothetical protein